MAFVNLLESQGWKSLFRARIWKFYFINLLNFIGK